MVADLAAFDAAIGGGGEGGAARRRRGCGGGGGPGRRRLGGDGGGGGGVGGSERPWASPPAARWRAWLPAPASLLPPLLPPTRCCRPPPWTAPRQLVRPRPHACRRRRRWSTPTRRTQRRGRASRCATRVPAHPLDTPCSHAVSDGCRHRRRRRCRRIPSSLGRMCRSRMAHLVTTHVRVCAVMRVGTPSPRSCRSSPPSSRDIASATTPVSGAKLCRRQPHTPLSLV